MAGFLKFILIVVIVVYALRFLVRVILPWWIKRQIRKMQDRQNSYYQHQQDAYKREEGKVTVQYKKANSSKKSSDGEYVDFEEVK